MNKTIKEPRFSLYQIVKDKKGRSGVISGHGDAAGTARVKFAPGVYDDFYDKDIEGYPCLDYAARHSAHRIQVVARDTFEGTEHQVLSISGEYATPELANRIVSILNERIKIF